jgi:hypothetical protein
VFVADADKSIESPSASTAVEYGPPTDFERAYAAGFFDGEGCVYMARTRPMSSANRPAFQLQTIVTNTNREPLEWLQQRWRGYIYAMSERQNGSRPGWQWRLQGSRQAGAFLRDLYEFSIEKRQLIDIALRFADLQATHNNRYGRKHMPEDVYRQQEALWLEHRAIVAFRGGPGRRRWSSKPWHTEFEIEGSGQPPP